MQIFARRHSSIWLCTCWAVVNAGSSLDETEVARTTNVDNFPSSQPPKRLKEDGGFTN